MNLPQEIERLLSLPADEARRDALGVVKSFNDAGTIPSLNEMELGYPLRGREATSHTIEL